MELSTLAKSLMLVGGFLLLLGGGVLLLSRLHFKAGPLLAGDIFFRKGNFTIFIPIVTCLVLSLLLTLLLNLLAGIRR